MLPAPNHLRKQHDISCVYRRGSYGSGGGLLGVKSLKTKRDTSRFVVVVSKKIDKRAVTRNRIRRRLNAMLFEQMATVALGYDIVISVHKDLSLAPADQIRATLRQALVYSKVIVTQSKDLPHV